MTTGEMKPQSDWQVLYEPLLQLLSSHGVNDAFGEGDFFLIDDDFGEKQHKVECRSDSFATPQLMLGIQQLLGPYPEGWEVILALPSQAGSDHAFVINRNGRAEHGA